MVDQLLSAFGNRMIINPYRYAGASTLLDGLGSQWKMNETSGTRVDSVSGYDLTDNNTVGFTTGKQGNAMQNVSANSEWLSASSPTGVYSRATDFSMSTVVRYDVLSSGLSTVLYLGSPGSGVPSLTDYIFGHYTSNRASFFVGGTLFQSVLANNFGVLTQGVFYHLMAWHDSSVGSFGSINISVNNGTTDTTNLTSAIAHQAGATELVFGRYGTPAFSDMTIDVTKFWSRVLTTDERTEDYNSGNGVEL